MPSKTFVVAAIGIIAVLAIVFAVVIPESNILKPKPLSMKAITR